MATERPVQMEPTPRQELVFMGRVAKAVNRMGSAGRRWVLRWLRDTYPEDWRYVQRWG